MATPQHHIDEAAAAVEHHFVDAKAGVISQQEAERRAEAQIQAEPKWDITAGSVLRQVYEKASRSAAPPEHHGSTAQKVNYYYNPQTGTKTFRVEGQPAPEGAIPITQEQFRTKEKLQVKETTGKEILVRQKGVDIWTARKSLSEGTPKTVEFKIKQPAQEKKYIVGRIPEKDAEIKTWAELTKEERHSAVQLPPEKMLHTIPIFKTEQKESTFFTRFKGEAKKFQAKFDIKTEKKEEQMTTFTEQKKGFKVGEKVPGGLIAAGVTYAGYYTFKGAASVFIHPIQTAKGVATTFIHPYKTGIELGKQFRERPAATTFETVGTMAALGKVGKTIKSKAPKIKYETMKVPATKGDVVLYRGLTIEAGKKGAGLIGVSDKKLVIGTPKVDLSKGSFTKGYLVESPTQTKIIRKSIPDKFPVEEVSKFESGLKITRKTEKVKSKFVQKEFIEEAKALTPKGVREVLSFAKRERADVYGSFAARQQMPKDLARTPADIDVQLTVKGEAAGIKAKQLLRSLEKTEGKGRVKISDQSPTLIETKQKGQWHHAVDIHSTDQALKDVASPAIAKERVYGLSLGQKPIKIAGVRTMRLSEQGVRKFGSIATIREKGFAPEAHRVKDIADFFTTQETLIRSKPFGKGRLMGELTQMKELYPPEIFKDAAPVKVPITSYKSPKFSSPTISPLVSPYKDTIISPSVKVISPSVSYPSPAPVSSPSISSPKISPSTFKSPSVSSPSMSPPSISPSKISSPKVSSPSTSPSVSPKSISASISPSVSKSVSTSPSVSPSKSISPSKYSITEPRPVTTTSTTLYNVPNPFREGKRAFKVEAKRFGKYETIATGLPKGRALKTGAAWARKTLGASFRIIPTKEFTTKTDIAFRPSKDIFRSYKIESGQKVYEEGLFIQKKGKRLESRTEVGEIQTAKLRAERGFF